jgi:hypothetical protein
LAAIGPARLVLLCIAGWSAVALLLAAQGYLVGHVRGSPQPWWPSFAYTAAIFSVWAMLTPGLVISVLKIEAAVPVSTLRWVIYGLGLPVTFALHVGMFVLLYWEFYNDNGQIASRWAMAHGMFVRNLDTDSLFYAVIVAGVVALRAWRRRAGEGEPDPEIPVSRPADSLRVKERGRVRFVPVGQIELIRAAGDYAEIVAGGETHLIEQSLTSLERILPGAEFARIHRATIVRIDLIREIRGVGRGDALVRLANGAELRLSRRYRKGIAALHSGHLPRLKSHRSRSPG